MRSTAMPVRCRKLHKPTSETRRQLGDKIIILSVDRLDYTKGIPERIRGFMMFLDQHPEYLEKVELFLIVAPLQK